MATFKRLLSRSIADTLTKIGGYDATGQTTIIGLTVANTDTNMIKVSVSIYDGTNTTYLVKDADVPQGGTIVVVGGDQKVVLESGDSIRVNTDSASNTCDAVMSVLEV